MDDTEFPETLNLQSISTYLKGRNFRGKNLCKLRAQKLQVLQKKYLQVETERQILWKKFSQIEAIRKTSEKKVNITKIRGHFFLFLGLLIFKIGTGS